MSLKRRGLLSNQMLLHLVLIFLFWASLENKTSRMTRRHNKIPKDPDKDSLLAGVFFICVITKIYCNL